VTGEPAFAMPARPTPSRNGSPSPTIDAGLQLRPPFVDERQSLRSPRRGDLSRQTTNVGPVRLNAFQARLQRCGDHGCPPSGCGDAPDRLHRKSVRGAGSEDAIPSSVEATLTTSGTPLETGLRGEMESRVGHQLDHVRIHTDPAAARSARDVSAAAYTVGPHVVFGAGRFRPATDDGRRLLTHELAHVAQQRGQTWPVGSLRMSQPGDPDEAEADRVSNGYAKPTSIGAAASVLHRTWEATGSPSCTGRSQDRWLRKVVVDQEKAQSVTLHWSDGGVTSSICSTGKGHCCVPGGSAPGTSASVSESRRNGSNATPIGSDFTISDTHESFNGWRFWNTFLGARGIALHRHHTVTGTPLSHGCVRLPEETAHDIFCGARQHQTRVEVRGFARPDCDEPELRAEWRKDFQSAGATVTDGERPEIARIIQSNRRESRRILGEAYGRTMSDPEIAAGGRGSFDIPRCQMQGAGPSPEAARSVPETGAGANVPSTSSELLARSGLESLIPTLANALDRARSVAAARSAAESIGRTLWSSATAAARGGRSDDRPSYWARVQLNRTIDQWQPSFRLSATQRREISQVFDRASRGMLSARPSGPRSRKRIVISGFDPFGLDLPAYGAARATNPSGAAALALDGRTMTNAGISGAVEAVVFPVSFTAFDEGAVEGFFRPFLSGPDRADMIMTISMNSGSAYEVEEYAGRTRGAGFPDNPGRTPGSSGPPPGLGPGPEFLRGTLPGSARRALGRTSPTTGEAEITEIPAGGSAERRTTTGPTPGSRSVAGSGGQYLSNEIFYRVALLRSDTGSSVPYGHLHVPFLSPDVPGFEGRRDAIIQQVERILTATLPDL